MVLQMTTRGARLLTPNFHHILPATRNWYHKFIQPWIPLLGECLTSPVIAYCSILSQRLFMTPLSDPPTPDADEEVKYHLETLILLHSLNLLQVNSSHTFRLLKHLRSLLCGTFKFGISTQRTAAALLACLITLDPKMSFDSVFEFCFVLGAHDIFFAGLLIRTAGSALLIQELSFSLSAALATILCNLSKLDDAKPSMLTILWSALRDNLVLILIGFHKEPSDLLLSNIFETIASALLRIFSLIPFKHGNVSFSAWVFDSILRTFWTVDKVAGSPWTITLYNTLGEIEKLPFTDGAKACARKLAENVRCKEFSSLLY